MGQDVKNQTRFCQKPTLMTSETRRQKLSTITMSLSEHTIAAWLQLATAFLFLLLGLISSNALNIIGRINHDYTIPMEYIWEPDLAWSLKILFEFVFLPLVISAVGFGLFYRLGMSDEKAWDWALLFNFFGILVVLSIFVPFILDLQDVFSRELLEGPYTPGGIHSYDSIWGILTYSIPLAVILNLALFIYLGARLLAVTWRTKVGGHLNGRKIVSNTSRRRLKWNEK